MGAGCSCVAVEDVQKEAEAVDNAVKACASLLPSNAAADTALPTVPVTFTQNIVTVLVVPQA